MESWAAAFRSVFAVVAAKSDLHALRSRRHEAVLHAFRLGLEASCQSRAKTHQRGSDFGGGDAHRVFTAAQNCSVTAVVSSATFQPFVSAFSLASLCSISSIFLVSAYGFQSALDSLA
ncbi:hypothetical protein ABIB85_007832 [Bradyrhizobium sp. JR1.5]